MVHKTAPIFFTKSKAVQILVYVHAGMKIAASFLKPEKPLPGNEKEIISQIHKIRFDTSQRYLITGGHFQQSYVRNRGIFFNALLDPRIPTSEEDWDQRQAIALKTIAMDLEVFRLAQKDYTTIVPLGGNTFTAINIYTRPSDSLFSILYTLSALTKPLFLSELFPTPEPVRTGHTLKTMQEGKKLISTYKSAIKTLAENYLQEVIDKETGLIRSDIFLSSARDGIKRQSSFYDNVIAWATCKLARELGIDNFEDYNLETWKKHIIASFWDEETEIFLDDLSSDSRKEKLFCADSFVTTSSGFFQTANPEDRMYLNKMIAYVKKHQLDEPFPLHYSRIDQPDKLYMPVRIFAPSYMGRSIWSHWGMEYIKTLILLSRYKHSYVREARQHLSAYRQNIEQYGGYPELYNSEGKFFSNRLYKSVLHNSWVINYEQAKMLLTSYSRPG